MSRARRADDEISEGVGRRRGVRRSSFGAALKGNRPGRSSSTSGTGCCGSLTRVWPSGTGRVARRRRAGRAVAVQWTRAAKRNRPGRSSSTSGTGCCGSVKRERTKKNRRAVRGDFAIESWTL